MAWRWVQVEIDALKPGVVQRREPAKPQRQTYFARRYGQQAYGAGSRLIGSLQVSEQTAEPLLSTSNRARAAAGGGGGGMLTCLHLVLLQDPKCTAMQSGCEHLHIAVLNLAWFAVCGLLCLRSKQLYASVHGTKRCCCSVPQCLLSNQHIELVGCASGILPTDFDGV